MSNDFLVDLGENPTARRVIKQLGLPLPMPQKLHRTAKVPYAAQPLDGKDVVVRSTSPLAATLSSALAESGATCLVEGADIDGAPWSDAAEAWARPMKAIDEGAKPSGSVHALVLDATDVTDVDDLRTLWSFFHPRMKSIATHGRMVVIGRTPDSAKDIRTRAARRALEGFTRALSKEIGAKGATANLIVLGEEADAALAGPLRFLLSHRSAFVDGQPLYVEGGTQPETVPWTRPLDGKAILLTGAARGIGAATAATLAREGAVVLCLDLPQDGEQLASVADRIGGVPVPANVTDPAAAKTILDAAGKHGGLYGIVHNAGITRDRTLAKMGQDRWDLTLDVNLRALLDLDDALIPEMHEGGRIVALSSVAGIAGNFGQTNYSASKAGVIGLVEATAPAVADRGITVNGIAPGFIETRLTAAIPVATREAGRRLSALAQGGQPLDIAETVTFLMTPGAWGMSGHVLRVCGGALIGA